MLCTGISALPRPWLLTWHLHVHAAYTAGVHWTCWNTIFLIFCIQAHNTRPFWKEGAHGQFITCSVPAVCHADSCGAEGLHAAAQMVTGSRGL